MSGDRGASVPVADWTPCASQLVLALVVHPNAAFAVPEHLDRYAGWHAARWTRLRPRCGLIAAWWEDRGGWWMWNGHFGTVTHVRPMPPIPAGAVEAMLAARVPA